MSASYWPLLTRIEQPYVAQQGQISTHIAADIYKYIPSVMTKVRSQADVASEFVWFAWRWQYTISTLAQFIWSTKVSNAYFSVAVLT